MMVANLTTLPESQDVTMMKFIMRYEFSQLADGLSRLDGRELPTIDASWFPIKEFRFYCYKPSHGRVVDLVTSQTEIGVQFRDHLLGRVDSVSCGDICPSAFRSLPDDTSEIKTALTGLGFGIPIRERLYNHAFHSIGYKYYYFHGISTNCDDYVDSDGEWKIYVR